MLDKLIILHLQEYIKPSGEVDQLKSMKKTLKPFAPMTCSRHVYVFMDLTLEHETKLRQCAEYLRQRSKTCDYLCGQEAYLFLLRWAIGLESHKLEHRDHFVLGTIRKEWDHFHRHRQAMAMKYCRLMATLFQDAKHMRQLIQHFFTYTVEDYMNKVRLMTQNCTLSRWKGIFPLYEKLDLPTDAYLPVAITAYLSLCKKQIKNLQISLDKKPDDLSDSIESYDERRKYIIKRRCFFIWRIYQLSKPILTDQSKEVEEVQQSSSNKQRVFL